MDANADPKASTRILKLQRGPSDLASSFLKPRFLNPQVYPVAGFRVLYRRGVYDPPELKPVWRRPNLTQVLEDTVGFGADQI